MSGEGDWLFDELFTASGRGDLHVVGADGTDRLRRDELLGRASRMAAGVRRAGLAPGDTVAALLTNSVDMLGLVLGAWLAGVRVASLPLPWRGGSHEEYLRMTGELCRRSEAGLLVCEARLGGLLADVDQVRLRRVEDLPCSARVDVASPADDDALFVQFTSGSTRAPAGCVLTAGAIGTQLRELRDALELDRCDRGVSWLPLSHDMSLFGGALQHMVAGFEMLLSTPERFVASPRTWLDDCAQFDATVTHAPNMALALATRIAERQPPRGTLSLRSLVLGGERVTASALRRAGRALGPWGLKPDALQPAYGLAEATLAVTVSAPSRPAGLHAFNFEGDRFELVGAGRALPGSVVSIDAADDFGFGEIVVTSASLASGYVGDPALTAARFTPSGLITGDIGTLIDGELFVLGRQDDLVNVAGRKVWLSGVEESLAEDDDVRSGSVVLLEREGQFGELRLTGLAELRRDDADAAAVAARLSDRARREFDVAVSGWGFAARGAVPKTPSGKVMRHAARRVRASLTDW